MVRNRSKGKLSSIARSPLGLIFLSRNGIPHGNILPEHFVSKARESACSPTSNILAQSIPPHPLH